jgi:hypothetical protein
VGCQLEWVRASTRVLSVVCGVVRRQEIIVRDRNVLFSSAGYKVNINVTTIGPLTTSSAGITV